MGNWKNGKLTDSGRKNVIEEFYQATGSHYKWDKFKNRIDTLRRSFHAYKRLAKNVRDVDFNPQTGGIEADELWWTERAKECKNIGKVRALCSIPLLEIIFDRRHVTAGNKCFGTVNLSVDQTALEGSGESEEFTNEAMRVQREPARTDSGKRSRSVTSLHKGKKTCKEEELVDHLSSSLEHQNMKSEESPEDRAQRYPYDIEVVYQKFISMDAVIDGSRFYWEGQKWLMEAETHRRWFMVQPDDAHRIELVERMTGVKCQALD